jgi:CDP-glucose 4,6-dehydratase
VTVGELAAKLTASLAAPEHPIRVCAAPLHEAQALAVDSSKARAKLGWSERYRGAELLDATAAWYAGWKRGDDPRELTARQLGTSGVLEKIG